MATNAKAAGSSGDLKQRIMVLNNQVSLATYGFGVKWQKVDVVEDKIIITERHTRIPALARLADRDRLLSHVVDVELIAINKEELRSQLTTELGLNVASIFKDYDPAREVAVTVILLDS